MNRRTIFIILAALAFAALLIISWWWFFNRESVPDTTGTFGSGEDRPGGGGLGTGGQNNVGSTVGTGGVTVGIEPGVGGEGTPGAVGTTTVGTPVAVAPGVLGATSTDWLGGTGSGGSLGGTVSTFVPSGVNQLSDGTTGGQVTILGTPPSLQSSDDLAGFLTAAGIGLGVCTAGLLTGGAAGLLGSIGLAPVAVTVNAPVQNAKDADSVQQRFMDCLVRGIGRAVVNQITASVVNWINSGFSGQPSFITNHQQFFTNVANIAAGEYIKGSGLSFLCSPFQLQVRIAVARSYANRGAQSCSLSQVSNNIENFMKGNFSGAGGWPALLSFTTVPTNNAYGAYAYAQIGLANAQATALQNANRNVTPGGFISFSQAYDCKATVPAPGQTVGSNGQLLNNSSLFMTPAQSASGVCPSNCKCRVATPGSIIESSLIGTQNNTLQQLGLAKSFDEIVSALISQLMVRTLQQGLLNLSGTNGYESNFLTPDQRQAQTQGNQLLTTIQSIQQTAQQYGTAQQGSIYDLQASQEQLQSLANCWEPIATSQGLYSDSQRAQAQTNANAAINQLQQLELQVGQRNAEITRANAAIALLQDAQTQLLSAGSTAQVKSIENALIAAGNAGQIISTAEVTAAQQNRTTLQGELAALNTQTATYLQQCYAFSQQ